MMKVIRKIFLLAGLSILCFASASFGAIGISDEEFMELCGNPGYKYADKTRGHCR